MSPAHPERLRFIFVFTALYGIILFLIRPDPTHAQVIFRTSLIAVGTAGLAWLQIRNRS